MNLLAAIFEVNDLTSQVLSFVWASWFVWVPLVLFFMFWEIWILYIRILHVSGLAWVLLEVRVPRTQMKSPRAMEMVFNALHRTKEGNPFEKYWQGFVKQWFSFEIASAGGDVRFFVRTPAGLRRLVEAQIYAQYPDTEIIEVDDYTKALPLDMPNTEYNLWGAEFGATKEDAYPIRTYVDFNLEDMKEEMEKSDPMSSLLEFMGSIHRGEYVWAQFNIRAADDKWVKEGAKLRDKMLGRDKPAVDGIMPKAMALSTGERDLMAALERNMEKLGFDSGIRMMYIARRDVFSPVNIASITGVLKQYNTKNLNGFKPVKTVSVDWPFDMITPYKMRKEFENQKKMLRAYRERGYFYPPFSKDRKSMVLTSEELATIYHYPGMTVSTPTFARTDTKKGAPPTNLPI
jgi:hypothetical protein